MGCPRDRLARLLAYPNMFKTLEEKIDAVLQLDPPKNLKQLQGFVGAIKYYRDMWPHRYHIMAPLNSQTGALKKANLRPLNGQMKCRMHLRKQKH